jgi:PfaB family protein
MSTRNRVIIAGVGVKSAVGEGPAGFSRVLYENTQHTIDTPFLCTAADVNRVTTQALQDAGFTSGGELTICICGDLPSLGLKSHLADDKFTISEIYNSTTISSGLEKVISSIYVGKPTVHVVLAKDDMGIGAFVIVREEDFVSGDSYGVIDSLLQYDLVNARVICQDAFLQTGIDPGEIGYFETTFPDLDDWVLETYRRAGYDLTCALSSMIGVYSVDQPSDQKPDFSTCSFIKTLFALQHRTLPPFPDWQITGEDRKWHHTPFYTVQEARPWFVEPGKVKRYAVWLNSDNQKISHIILSELDTNRSVFPVKSQLGDKTVWLLPVTGESQRHLQQNLKKLIDRLENGEALQKIYHESLTLYTTNHDSPYALAVVGRDRNEVLHEFKLASAGVDKAFTTGKPYRTPRGSVFTSNPLSQSDVAFVYPGAFNSYVDFGRELLLHFPVLHERLSVLISNVGRSLAERRLYPRSLERLSESAKQAWTERLTQNPIALIESGTTFAIAYSMIIRDIFGVEPQSAMGYSLGEISMLWSAGVWNTGDAGSDAWHASPLFKTRLFGPKQAVRDAWDIEPEDDTFWSTYLLKAPEEKVRNLVDQEPRVYLTIVNLPDEVVIAGDGEGCQRIINALGCHAIKTPFDSVIHNEVVRSEYDTFVKLYTHPIQHIPNVVFYSAAEYAPLEMKADSLAHAIADMTCKPVHLPRLVRTVYQGGARIFIELGPQATCTRWINRILRDQPHVAVPINRTGLGDYHGVITVLAQLITNRIRVNLLPLLPEHQQESSRRIILHHKAPSESVPIDSSVVDVQNLVNLLPQKEKVTVDKTISRNRSSQLNTLNSVFDTYVLPHRTNVADNHMTFLKTRHRALQNFGSLIEMQMTIADKMFSQQENGNRANPNTARTKESIRNRKFIGGKEIGKYKTAFTKRQLEEFASGNVEKCFGEKYAVYRGRRLPRIPNGDLLLMSRIVDIDGTPGILDSHPSLVSEYDVPNESWFFAGNPDAIMPPYAVLMEIALQPCGFLSAYLGSTLSTPHVDYYFRNLDGYGQLISHYPVRGKSIRNKVKLISSISLKGIIMQRYEFSLECEETLIYQGGATFGYFTIEALSDQVGLDKGATVSPYFINHHYEMRELKVYPLDQRHGLERCKFSSDGGRYGKGYIYGEAEIDPNAWFFKCHFYQDPVMPGSLGVDIMYQAFELGLYSMLSPKYPQNKTMLDKVSTFGNQQDCTWVYRGQVTPDNQKISIELHIKDMHQDADGITSTADASLWVDDLRIYNVENLSMRLASK